MSSAGIGYATVGRSGPAVVFLAGRGSSYRSWLAVTRSLPQSYRCVLADLRGMGTSTLATGPFDIATFARDTAGLLAEVGIERAHLVGASIGAAVVQRMCIEHPHLAASATLMSTWSSARRHEAVRRWLEARMAALAGGNWEVYHAFSYLMVGSSNLDSTAESLRGVLCPVPSRAAATDIDADLAHYRAGLGHESHDQLGLIHCPVQVVYGAEDVVTVPAYNRDVAAAIDGAALHEIPRAGHLLRLEAPDVLARVVAAFLAGCSGEVSTRKDPA